MALLSVVAKTWRKLAAKREGGSAMKQFTHAWLAFMAIKRLEDAGLPEKDRKHADNLIEWFRRNKDGVIRGAWYPDTLIVDNLNSHVLKFKPSGVGEKEEKLRQLPKEYLSATYSAKSTVWGQPFTRADPKDNLPDRCESLTESVVDHLKIQESEEKGSAVSPTDNQVALLLFMLSHYIADAHMPLHCDDRKFSEGKGIHAHMEKEWDDEIEHYYEIDKINERFSYNPEGYPLLIVDQQYPSSFLKRVEDGLKNREFNASFEGKNSNVWDLLSAVCQYSYFVSYYLFPKENDYTNVTWKDWESSNSEKFENVSIAVFSDAIDSIARVWFRLWRRYEEWYEKREKRKK